LKNGTGTALSMVCPFPSPAWLFEPKQLVAEEV
jgi:hypothetical protein